MSVFKVKPSVKTRWWHSYSWSFLGQSCAFCQWCSFPFASPDHCHCSCHRCRSRRWNDPYHMSRGGSYQCHCGSCHGWELLLLFLIVIWLFLLSSAASFRLAVSYGLDSKICCTLRLSTLMSSCTSSLPGLDSWMRTLCQEGFCRQPSLQAAFASSEAGFASFEADQVEVYHTMAG